MVASAVAWLAIGRAGSEVLDPAAQRLPTTSGSAPGTPDPTGSTAHPDDHPTGDDTAAVVRHHGAAGGHAGRQGRTVTGGQAGFRCSGAVLSLKFAQPATGWSVKSSASDGGARLRVEFEADGQRTRVEATCVSGGPSVSVESDTSGGGGGGGGGGGRRRGRRLSPCDRVHLGRPVRWPHDGGPAPACREEPRCATC